KAAVQNRTLVSDIRWMVNGILAFLRAAKTGDQNLCTVDVKTGALKKLTLSGQDVTQFDVVGDTAVYTVAVDTRRVPEASEIVLTGRSILSALNWESPRDFPQLGTPAELWTIRENQASAVMEAGTGKPIQLITDILSLSPSGRYVVVTQHANRIPEDWVSYEPASS